MLKPFNFIPCIAYFNPPRNVISCFRSFLYTETKKAL